jgi:hypothetical protein
MIYETNIGWIYIEDYIYLKLEFKNIIKILKNIDKIEKINIKKKFLVLKNIDNIKIMINYTLLLTINKNNIKVKDLLNIEYSAVEWVFAINNNNEKRYKNIELGTIEVSIENWLCKKNKLKFESIEIKIFKNEIEIKYEKRNLFMVYLYINAIKDTSKIYSEKIKIIINNKEIDWEIENLEQIKKMLENSKECKILNEQIFSYYIDIMSKNKSLLK